MLDIDYLLRSAMWKRGIKRQKELSKLGERDPMRYARNVKTPKNTKVWYIEYVAHMLGYRVEINIVDPDTGESVASCISDPEREMYPKEEREAVAEKYREGSNLPAIKERRGGESAKGEGK